jgi:hypothetical protein
MYGSKRCTLTTGYSLASLDAADAVVAVVGSEVAAGWLVRCAEFRC